MKESNTLKAAASTRKIDKRWVLNRMKLYELLSVMAYDQKACVQFERGYKVSGTAESILNVMAENLLKNSTVTVCSVKPEEYTTLNILVGETK